MKQDRKDTIYGLTRSVCPTCNQLVDATYVVRGGALVLRSFCPEHGFTEALVARDAARHHRNRRFNKPGTIPLHFERTFHGCPDSCGICPEHQQHTCLGIIDVTSACNLACPACFAAAGPHGAHLSVSQIGAMMDRLIRCEGDPEVVQLSGGEPTLHPEIVEIVALAHEKGLGKVLINTNGVRLVEDPGLLDRLAEHDPTIYLQFDGFTPETYRALRGRDLSELKREAVARISERGLRIVLVATVVRGVNDHEVGALVDYALAEPQVRSVNFQPATFTGRFTVRPAKPAGAQGEGAPQGAPSASNPFEDPMDRFTLDDLAEAISAQSRHGLRPDDFFPIPCPDPACSIATYLHQTEGEVRPLPRLVNVEEYLDYFKNVSVAQLTDELRRALESLFSMSAVPGDETSKSFCTACAIELDWGAIEQEITMISAMHFMDEHTFDLARARKCCVHQILPDDGGIIPFCNYNVLWRRRPRGGAAGEAE